MHLRIVLTLLAISLVLVLLSGAASAGDAPPPPDAGAHAVLDAGPDKGIGTSPSSPAAGLPDPSTPGELAGGISGAARAGKWMLVIALIVNAVVWLLRRFTPFFLRKLGAWFGEDRGGTVLALSVGLLTVLVIQLQSGHVDGWLLLDGIAAGLLGVGNYTAPKKLGGNP